MMFMKANNSLKTVRVPLLVMLIVIQGVLLLRLTWLTSPNRTELGHFVASRYFWEYGQFDLFHVNPPLLRIIAGMPVYFLADSHDDWSSYSPQASDRSEWAVAVSLIQANDMANIRWIFFLARTICIPLVLLGGWVGFRYTDELFGEMAGFVFLVTWTFSPLILGWGATICPDVAAASLGLIGFYLFRRWLMLPNKTNTVLSGICLGLLPLVKMTWVIVFFLIPVLWLMVSTSRKTEWHKMLVLWTFMLLIVNLGYFFDGTGTPLGRYHFISETLKGAESENRFVGTVFESIPVPFPKEFILGLDTQRRDFERGFLSYLCGRYSDHGWWYYYLVALILKEPLGTILLALMAVFLIFHKPYRSTFREEIILVFPGIVLFAVVSSQTGFSLHTRYIIPALPFFYVWISRVGRQSAGKNRIRQTVIILLLTSVITGSMIHYPYCLSYFSEGIGGPANGPKYLLGSNVEWGQDLYELKTWYEKHFEARPLRIAYSGLYPLESLGIRAESEPPPWTEKQSASNNDVYLQTVGPQPGWFLLGINDLYGPTHAYDWLHDIEPTHRIGYSMNVYHLTLEQANEIRRRIGIPELR